MESQPSLETVYAAIEMLYHHPRDKEKASQWLADLQSSVFAWKIADDMLREKRSLESCYFAAQTLRTKIQYSFQELTPEVHISLRNSLMDHLDQINENTSSVIVTQLTLAIATLALQMSQWEKPIMDLMARYSERSPGLLLEIITVFPEEIHSRLLRLGENRRKKVIAELEQSAPNIINFLKLCFANGSEITAIQVQAIKCFASCVGIGAIDMKNAPDIINHIFTVLATSQVQSIHEAATDCVCILLQCLENCNDHMLLGQQLNAGVVSLEEAYHMSVAHENTERSINFCRIFTELAETFLEEIIKTKANNETHYASKVFDLVLICVGHHDYEVAEITFNLWCRLSEELYKQNNDTLTISFKPCVERLIASLCRHSRIEPDHEGLLEEGEDFLDFRHKVSELIKDVIFIIGSSSCFRQMFIDLQTPGVTWDASEAALFVMQAVAKNILPDENEVVPKVVGAILNLPPNTHIAVLHTSVLLLGELCEWIDLHPESLEPTLNFILCGLKQPLIASAAATALTSICSTCRRSMIPNLPGLLQVIQAMDTLHIKQDAALGLLHGMVAVVCKAPPNEIEVYLRKMCEVQLAPLVYLTKTQQTVVRGESTDPSILLDRLSMTIRYLHVCGQEVAHPCAAVFKDMWPILSVVCDKYQSNGHVVERWCRCIRYTVRCLGRQFAHFLHPVVKQIVSQYSVHRISAYVYLGSILVDECAGEPQCVEELMEMMSDFIQPTFALLQETNGLKNHPDTVEDFLRLCMRYLQWLPCQFLHLPALPLIMECALMSCSLDHRDANGMVMKFFRDLYACTKKMKSAEEELLLDQFVQPIGKRLVNNLIQASVFSLHTHMLSGVSEVLWSMLEYNRTKMREWLKEALSALPTQNSGGITTATQDQLNNFFAAISTAKSLKEVNQNLRDFARLYR